MMLGMEATSQTVAPEEPIAPKSYKAVLIERGQWPAFNEHVKTMHDLGKTLKVARNLALVKFFSQSELQDFGVLPRKGGRVVVQGPPDRPVAPVAVAAARPAEPEVEAEEMDLGDEVEVGRSDMPKPRYVDMKIFDGRDCSEVESIRWVGKVMGMHGVRVKDCPSASAWNLMNHCRADPDFRKTFWGSMYVKAIRRGSDEGDDGESDGKGDGEKTMALCGRLLEISEALKKGASDG